METGIQLPNLQEIRFFNIEFLNLDNAFCKRFSPELAEEIFDHILNKALNNRMVDPSIIFVDGTHIKASANKKKFQKEMVAKTANIILN